jgi:hypothetical protein
VNPTPTVNAVTSFAICKGATGSAITFSSPTSGSTFSWTSSANVGFGTSGTGSIGTYTAVNAGTTPVVATVSVTATATGCTGPTITFNVTVNPAPTVNAVTSVSRCNGVSGAGFSFSSPTGGATFAWTSSANVGFGTSGTGSIGTFTATNTGASPVVATVSVTATGGVCTGPPTTFNVTVNPTPTVNAVTSFAICNGATGSAITFFSPTAGSTFSWTSSANIGFGTSGTSIGTYTAVNAGTTPVVATVSVTATASSCAGPTTIFNVTVNPTPTVNAVTSFAICNGATGSAITFSSPTAGSTFSWTSSANIGFGTSGTSIGTYTAVNAGTTPVVATVSVTATASSCAGPTITFNVTVNPTPTANAVTSFAICNGATGSAITFSSPTAGSTFSWTSSANVGFGTSGTGSIGTYTAVNAGITPVVATVSVTATANGCAGPTTTFNVTVNPTPTVNAVTSFAICNGATGSAITFSSPTAGSTFSWTSSANVGFGTSGTSIGTYTAVNAGTTPVVATVSVTATANGCAGPTITFNVTVNLTPTLNAVTSVSRCNGVSGAGFSFSSPTGGATFAWTSSVNVGFGTSGTGSIGTFTATNTGTSPVVATVSVTATAGGCTGSPTTFNVTVNPTPTVDAVTSFAICNGATGSAITFSSPTAGSTFSWTSSANVGFGISGTSIGTYTAVNAGTTPVVATVSVTATASSCAGPTITFNVTVNPTPTVNAVTSIAICNGVTGSAITFSSPTAGSTFSWTSSVNVGFGTSGTGIGTYTAVNAGTTPVVATVSVTATANGCAGPTTTFNVTVNPTPNVTVHGDSTYCNGASAPGFVFNSSVAGTTFSWTSSTSVGFPASGTGNINAFTAINGGSTVLVTTVIVTPSANGCTGVADTFLITVNPTADVAAHGDSTYCNGQPAGGLSFNGGVTGSTFTWTSSTDVGFGLGNTGDITAYTGTNTTTATIVSTVTVTPSANGCAGTSDTFLITVNPTPDVAAHGDSTYCNGASAGGLTFSGGVSGTLFTWTSSADIGFGLGNTGNIAAYTATNTTTATIVSTMIVTPSANGCTSTSDTFLITVNPTPNVAAHGDSTYCNGASAGGLTFSGGVDGTLFTWTASTDIGFGLGNTGNIPAYTATNTTTATIVSTVIVTPSASGCTGTSDTFLITVNPTPNVAAHGDSTYCNGVSAGGLTFSGGVDGTFFTWTASTDIGFGLGNTGNITGYIATNTTTATIVSTVIATPSANGCTGTPNTFLITVNPTPDVAVHGDSTYCNGASAGGLTFSGGVDGTLFTWTASTDVGFGLGNTGNIAAYTATNTTTGTIVSTVIVSPSANGCTGTSDTFLITVSPTPNVAAHGDSTYCNGASAGGLTFSGGVSGTLFTWTASTDVGFGLGNTGNILPYTATNTTTATIVNTVIVTPSANGCTGVADTFLITVSPTPDVATHGDSTYCNGASAGGLTFSGGVDGTLFTWTASIDVGFGLGNTGNIAAYTATNTTTATIVSTVIVTPSANGCTGTSDTFLITINPIPNVVAHGDSTYCNGASAGGLTFSGGVSGTLFTWTSSTDVGFGLGNTGNIAAYTATNTTTATIVSTVIVTPSASGCTGTSNTFLIRVNPTPDVAAHGDSAYCNGASAGGLTFSGGVTGTFFTWIASTDVGFGLGNTGNITAYTATNTTTATIVSTVIITPSANGCTSTSDTFRITVNPTPNVAAHGDSTYCNGASAGGLTFSGGVSGTLFTWTSSTDVGFGLGNTGNIAAYTATNTTTATIVSTVIVTPSANGCTGTLDTFLITVNPTPDVAAHGDSTYCNGASAGGLTFSGGVSGTLFTWTSSTDVGFGLGNTGNIAAYTATNTTTATIVSTMIVTPSANGCMGTPDTFLITVNPTPDVAAHGDSTYCNGQPAGGLGFSGGVAGTAFTWTSSADVGFGTGSTGNIPSYIASNPSLVQVVATVVVTPSAYGCAGIPDTFLITVNPNPTIDPITNRVHCNGDTAGVISFTGGVPGATFTWISNIEVGFGTSGTGSIGSYTAANGGATPAVATVTVTPSATGCPGAIATFMVTVNPTPNVAAHGDSTYCNGASAGGLTFSGGVDGTFFTWTASTDVGFGLGSTGNIAAYTATNTTTATIVSTVIVTPSANGCTGTSDTFLITANPTPNVAAHGDSTYCNGASAGGLTFSGGVSGTLFTWTSSTDVGFGLGNTGNITAYTATNTTTATIVSTVIVTPSANGCTGVADTFLITVNPTPDVAAHGDSTYCNGASAGGLTFSGGVTGTFFTWIASTDVGFGLGNTGNITAYTATNTTTATIVSTVIITPSANGCTGTSDTFPITVNPTPNVAAHGDSTYCNGASAGGLTFSGGVSGTLFTWTSSTDVGFGLGNTGNIAAYTATNTTTATIVSTVIVTPSANGCTGTSDTFLITVNPTPDVAAHGDSTYCNGASAGGLTFSGGVSGTLFTWTSSTDVGFGLGNTGNIAAYTATNTTTATIVSTVIVTPSANGCTGTSDTFLITVNPTPNVAAHGDSTYCNGQPAGGLGFSGGVAGTAFTWTSSADLGFGTGSTGNIPAYVASNPTLVQVVATLVVTPSTNGCTGTPDTFLITVNPNPTIDPITNRVHCNGDTAGVINFTGGVPGTTFTWTSNLEVGFGTSGTGSIGSYTAANGGATPAVAAVTVTPSATGCPGAIATFMVTVNPTPNVAAHGDSTYCNGASAAGFTFSGGVSGTLFTWTASTNVGFGLGNTGNIAAYTATNTTTATIVSTVIVAPSANGCTGTSDTFLITVNPTPSVVAHGDSTYCNGALAGGLTFSGGVDGTLFTWTASTDVGFGLGNTGNIAAYTATNTTTATIVSTVIVTPSANGCTGTSDTFLITVNPTPSVAAHGDSTYCNGASAGGLTFSGGVDGTLFTWTASTDVGFGLGNTGNIAAYTATNTTTATIVSTVTVTPSANGCTGTSDTFLITVNPTPDVAAHGDSTYCNGASAGGLTFSGGVSGSLFTWTSSTDVGFGLGNTGNIAAYTATNTTTATIVSTVIVTPSANGCMGVADTFLITVNPTPDVAAHGDSIYCNGASAGGLSFSGGVSGTLFTWTSSTDVGFGLGNTGDITAYTATNTTTATVVSTVIVTPSANGCTGTSDTFLIIVNPTPNVTAHGDSTYCNGASAGGLTFSGGVSGTLFTWTASTDVGFGLGNTGSIAAYTATNTTTATIVSTVIVTPSANGCTGTPDTFLITVNPTPDVAAHGDSTYCNGASAGGLTFSGSVSGTLFTWTSSTDVGFGLGNSGDIAAYTATNTTTATIVSTVIVTPSANGCTGTSDTFLITVNPTPNVAAHGDSTYCNGQPAGGLSFSGGVAGTTFTWTSSINVGFGTANTGDIPSYVASNPTLAQVVATVVVTPSASGCTGTPDTSLITVNPNPTIDPIANRVHCNGDTAGVINFTGGVPGATFTWTSNVEVGFGTSGTGSIGSYTAANGGTTPAVATVTVTPSATGCPGAIATFMVTVNPTPNVAAHGDSTYCNGASAGGLTFSGVVSGTLFTWTSSTDVGFGLGNTGNILPYVATNTTTATIVSTVIVTPSASGCTGTSDTFLITVNPTPNVVAHGDSTYCNGQPAGGLSFSGGVTGTAFTWTSSSDVGFGTGDTGNIPAYVASNSTLVQVVATVVVTPSAEGCTGAPDTFLITVNPNPTIDPITNRVHCNGDTAGVINFTGGVPGATFTWTSNIEVGFHASGTGSIGSYTAANGGASPAVATVTVTPSATGCPGAIATFMVTVNPTPNVAAHGDSTYCNGASAGGLTLSGGVSGTLFTWTASTDVGFGLGNTGNIAAYTATNTTTATIVSTVIVTPSANGCTGTSDTFLITVNPTPDVAAHGDSTYCAGVSAPGLNFSGTIPGTTFSWTSSANVGFGTSNTGDIPAYTALNGGLVPVVATVIVTPSAGDCIGTPDTFLITVNPNPTINPVLSRLLCAGNADTAINFSGSIPGITFTWVSSLNVGFGTNGTGNIGAYFAANGGVTPAIATVTVTPGITGCGGGLLTFLVTVNPTPNVAPHGDSTYCTGVLVPGLSFAGAVSGTTFNWTSSANVGFGTSGTGNIPVYTALNGGSSPAVATVIVTPSAGGCPGVADTFVITVNPTPNVAAHGDSTYCAGVLASGLNFTGGIPGTTFAWASSTNVGFGTGGSGNIPAYTALNGGLVPVVATVLVTPSADGCTGTPDTFLVTVNPNPSIDAVADRLHCAGDAGAAITFGGTIPGIMFTWVSSLNVGFGTNGTGNIGTYTALNSGSTPVVATVTVTPSVTGCGGGVITFMVTVNPTPNVVAHGDSTYCPGVGASGLNFTGSVAGAAFSWTSSANVGFGSSGTGDIPSYTTLNPGSTNLVATVIVTPSKYGCEGIGDTFLITVTPTPNVVAHGDSTYCAGMSAAGLSFTGTVGSTVFTWTSSANVGFGTGGSGNILTYTTLNLGVTNLVATVTVTPSAYGCTGMKDTFLVTVKPTPNVVAHEDSVYCNGTIAPVLTFAGSVAGTAFVWTSSTNIGFGTGGSGNIPPYTTMNPGSTNLITTVIVTPSAYGCTGVKDTILVTVKPTPNVVAHGDSVYCKGILAPALGFTSAVAGATFVWSSSVNVGFGLSGTGNISPYLTINPGLTNLVTTVIVTPSAYGCAGAKDTFLVTVKPTPTVYAHTDTTYCIGQSAAAIAFAGGTPGTTFTWMSSANVGFGTAGSGNIPAYTAAGGASNIVATVIVTPSAYGCTGAKDTFLVTVKPAPIVPTCSNLTVCSGVLVPMINTTGGDVVNTFTWSGTLNLGFGTSGTGNISPFTAINNPGPGNKVDTVTVMVSSPGGCIGIPKKFTITVLPKVIVVARDTTICSGTSFSLLPIGTPAGGTWTGPGVSGTTFSSAGLIAGTYKIKYTVSNGSCTGYDSAYINVTECCVVYGTYTQGVYSSNYGLLCDGSGHKRTSQDLITYLLNLGGQITVGRPGRSVVVPTYAAATVAAVMPGSYGPNKLTYAGNVTISNTAGSLFATNYLSAGKLKNSLLGEQITMKLNTRMSPGLVNFPIQYAAGSDSYFQTFIATAGCCCTFTCGSTSPNCFTVKNSVAKYLTKGGTQAATLTHLINLADDLLGGVLTPGTSVGGYIVPPYAEVAGALGTISSAFNYFRTFNGNYGCTSAKGAIAGGGSTGEPQSLEAQIKIYPNPTTGAFTIEVPALEKDAHVTVLDMNGRSLLGATMPANPYEQILQLEMPDTARGMYFIRIETGGKVFARKLMLE